MGDTPSTTWVRRQGRADCGLFVCPQFSSRYDAIGNRLEAASGTTPELPRTIYSANAVNQYAVISEITNGVVSAATPSYDAAGNLTNYNGWIFRWDGENRLILASNAATVVCNQYDYMSRRIMKTVSNLQSEAWTLKSQTRFVYDGWNLIADIHSSASGSTTNLYTWGLDLSGTLQGAGGVGGLLARTTQASGSSATVFYTFDGNGNVINLVGDDGVTVAAHYEYDPFGNITLAEGVEATSNPWRFSTKYFDSETGLLMYQLRPYSPGLGRFVSRDPAEEQGGENLYGFVGNSAVNGVDALGLYLVAFDGTGNYKGRSPATNVERLFSAYRRKANYYPGVGSRWWSKISGGLHGLGGEARIENAWTDLVKHYKNMTDAEMAQDPIDIIGFSRGAALARHFANIINQRGDPRRYKREIRTYQSGQWITTQREQMSGCPMPVRFLGIFDTVASFGMPGDRSNPGFDLSIPQNVKNVRHATARDEARSLFPLTRIKGTTTRIEKMFPGVHSDVGGGYGDNKDIQYGPLLWMWQEGKNVGVPWDKPSELEGWMQPAGPLQGHQSNVNPLKDHPTATWAPIGPNDTLSRPDSWEE